MTPPNRPPDDQALIRRQFSAHAQAYVTSRDHQSDATLAKMVALLKLTPNSRVLDVATGGGHTALALARETPHVVASDLTHRMLQAARGALRAAGPAPVGYVQADAHSLPWGDDRFAAVTCRVAAHHFTDVARFVRECARVTRVGGRVAVIDNITPADPPAARYVNALEKLRDPSHGWEYSAPDWESFFRAVGLEIVHVEQSRMSLQFHGWVERMSVPEVNRRQLRALLHHAPGAARESLHPREEDGQLVFDLGKVLVIGRKP